MKQLRGTGVAIITPFDKERKVDFEALKKITNHIIDGNVETIVVMGTTGESATLSKDEKKAVLNTIMEVNAGRKNIVLGIGGNNTAAVAETLSKTDFTGIDAVLSVSPAYNKPTQEGIYRHYEVLSKATGAPIILYNVPSRTSSNILPTTTLHLANDFNNIIGIKEASGNVEQAMQIIKDRPEGFLVFSGDDMLTLPIIAMGGDGVISVAANAFPKGFADMARAGLNNDMPTARRLHYKLMEIIKLLYVEGNPGGIKATMKVLNFCDDYLRLPLANVSDATFNKIKVEVEKYAIKA